LINAFCVANPEERMLNRPHALVLLLLLPTAAVGEQWKSSDEKIAVTIPDAPGFVKVEAMPPLIWVSKDETIKLGVVEMAVPANTKLIQSALERGFAESIQGKIVASSKDVRAGHDVFVMTAQGKLQDSEVYMTQAVVGLDGKLYKVMATGIGKDIRTDPDATRFIESLTILVPPQAAPSTGQIPPPSPEDSWANQWSRKLGGMSMLLLIGCGVVLILRRIVKGS
jgi:hypothetical protein